MKRAILGLALLGGSTTAAAQEVISAEAGLVYYAEGRTFLNDRPLQLRFGHFPQMKDGDVFRTGRSRAEVLLTPDVFLRLGSQTLIRMVSGLLTDTRVELLSGRAVLNIAELHKENAVSIECRGTAMTFRKGGVYHLNADLGELRVYEGQALARAGGQTVKVGKGKRLLLDGSLSLTAFNRVETDSLGSWSIRRSAFLTTANGRAVRALGGTWAWRPRAIGDLEAGAP